MAQSKLSPSRLVRRGWGEETRADKHGLIELSAAPVTRDTWHQPAVTRDTWWGGGRRRSWCWCSPAASQGPRVRHVSRARRVAWTPVRRVAWTRGTRALHVAPRGAWRRRARRTWRRRRGWRRGCTAASGSGTRGPRWDVNQYPVQIYRGGPIVSAAVRHSSTDEDKDGVSVEIYPGPGAGVRRHK